LAASICGHERADKPNRTAIDWNPIVGVGTHLCVALSGGQGSVTSFRSREGAEFAVKIATDVIPRFLDCQPDVENHAAVKRAAENELPKAITSAWARKVREHLDSKPFAQSDWEQLPEIYREPIRCAVADNPLLAYGASLLTVVALPSFILYVQIGDGDVQCVEDDGAVSRPLIRNGRLIAASETTSLCLTEAWRDFRVGFQTFGAQPPALILLSTDGYANSFRTGEDFLRVGSDILDMLRSDGPEAVQDRLEGWLRQSSGGGSGGDATLGVISRA
jgi:hypothetical protein